MSEKKQDGREVRRIALVTGATGFVGTHLTRFLVREGWAVHSVCREKSRIPSSLEFAHVVNHVHNGTIESMVRIVGTARPTIVFHLASLFLAQHQHKDVEPLIRSNILFGTQLIEAMVQHGVHLLINTGTSWQHYNNQEYSPACLYAATKQAFEALLQYYTETHKVVAVTLDLFDTYGPDDPRLKLFTLLQRARDTGQTLDMSPGGQCLDLVHINDVTSAFYAAAQRLLDGVVIGHEKYVVSSGRAYSLREIVEIFERVHAARLLIRWGARPYRTREVMEPWTKGCSLPGWQPLISLEEGLRTLA